MTDSVNVFPPFWRFLDENGDPVAGGYLEFYLAGSSTPLSVYSDAGLTSALGTTVYCDSGGHPVASSGSSTKVTIWTGTTDYKVVGKTSTGTTLGTLDNFPGALDTSTYATTTARPIGNVVAKASTTWSASTSDGSGTLYNANVAGGSQVVTLPSAVTAGNGYLLGIRHDGQGSSNTVTYQTVSSQAIKEGHASASVAAGTLTAYGETKWFQSDGAEWTLYSYVPPLTRRGEALVVTDRLAAAPTSPTAGAVYLITGTPTGAWLALGFAADDLVRASGVGTWTELGVTDGMKVYVVDEQIDYQRRGATWVALDNTVAPTTDSYVRRFIVEEQQAQNTFGGGSTADTWADRTLNATVLNTLTTANGAATDAALDTNLMTIPAGSYDVVFKTPLYTASYAQNRLIQSTAWTASDSYSVGTGSKTFTIGTGKSAAVGSEVYIFSTGTTTRIMEGAVAAYNTDTGVLTVNVTRTSGSGGPSTDWSVQTVLYGQTSGAGQTAVQGSSTTVHSRRPITLAAAETFKLQSITANTQATYGLGYAANRPGQFERYSYVEWTDVESLRGPSGEDGPQGQPGTDGALGLWNWETSTSTGPISGAIRFNNATFASVTAVYINETDLNGTGLGPLLATWDDSTSTIKGTIICRENGSGSNFFAGDVTALTDNGTDVTLTVTHRASSGSFGAGDDIGVVFIPKGDKGDTGAAGANGSAGATGAAGAIGATGPNTGLDYAWSTATSGDPGSGNVLANNATLASATAFNISYTGRNAEALSAFISTWNDSTNTSHLGHLRIFTVADRTEYIEAEVTGLTDNTTYATLAATVTAAGGSPSANDVVAVMFERTGNKGADGAGTGDVVGPAAATANSLARYDGSTGKLLKDGAVIGTDVQAYSANLATWSGLAPSANGQSLVTAADYSAMRTLLGLVIGTDVQAYSANLASWAGVAPASYLTTSAAAAAYQPLDSDLTSWSAIARATGFDTFAATPSSANLAALLTDETGSGANVHATSPTLVTPVLGAATATSINNVALTAPATGATLTIADGKTLTASNSIALAGTDSTTMTFPPASAEIGYLNVPQNSQSAAYTLVLADAGKHIFHPSADTTARTWTIPANSSVAYPVGTVLTFVNEISAGVITIAITTDTMYLSGAGTTGSRTLAAHGMATAIKMTSTTWLISGTGLT